MEKQKDCKILTPQIFILRKGYDKTVVVEKNQGKEVESYILSPCFSVIFLMEKEKKFFFSTDVWKTYPHFSENEERRKIGDFPVN